MSFTPLSLSEVHRRRAMRLSSEFSVQSVPLAVAECTQNEDDELEEQQA
jgi:hypothetical protein